ETSRQRGRRPRAHGATQNDVPAALDRHVAARADGIDTDRRRARDGDQIEAEHLYLTAVASEVLRSRRKEGAPVDALRHGHRARALDVDEASIPIAQSLRGQRDVDDDRRTDRSIAGAVAVTS